MLEKKTRRLCGPVVRLLVEIAEAEGVAAAVCLVWNPLCFKILRNEPALILAPTVAKEIWRERLDFETLYNLKSSVG